MSKKKVIIMGAAGRDFHNFNVFFRENEDYDVVAFTAEQIPGIGDRMYPPELSGPLYPKGIKIYPEEKLPELIKEHDVEQCILAYSDLPYEVVGNKIAWVNSLGPDMRLMGPKNTMIKSKKPVVAICAVRTGCGKSQTSRRVNQILLDLGLKPVNIRHPMPYDPDLTTQISQRYEKLEDMDKYRCTIEEREEYEPMINMGVILYAGVDYAKILEQAETEADVITWDGGNNDLSFYTPDLLIVIADPHRPSHEISYYPGETNLRMADVVVINKIDTADYEDVEEVRENIMMVNPNAMIVDAASPLTIDDMDTIRGKRVIVVEDGPTVTHGDMPYGAGYIAARKAGAIIVDPRPFAIGSIKDTFEKYSHLENVLPAMGYGKKQMDELQQTINKSDVDAVIIGTPIDLNRVIKIDKPNVRVRYDLQEIGRPNLEDVLTDFVKKHGLK
ncbi:MAG: Cyclic 2,3-diphosphoglycerate synthetase [Candidatus Thorarchaeota archaeon AB_25]|nr:MAG: Cyclic 2,3-diphosphoglycerate synthetase [Candidatus Thorarchaeota archaeon AB_25]